jgi:putative membrane protein DUF747
MPPPDPTDEPTSHAHALPSPSPSPSPTSEDPKSNLIYTARSATQKNDPAVQAQSQQGLEHGDPRSENSNLFNPDLTTPVLSDNAPPALYLSQPSPSHHAQDDRVTSTSSSKPRPSPLTESTNRPARKLSAAQVVQLTSQPLSPKSIALSLEEETVPKLTTPIDSGANLAAILDQENVSDEKVHEELVVAGIAKDDNLEKSARDKGQKPLSERHITNGINGARRNSLTRTVSTPPLIRRKKSHPRGSENQSRSKGRPHSPPHLNTKDPKESSHKLPTPSSDDPITPTPTVVPISSLSLPTYLQLELAADSKSSFFRHLGGEYVYESSAVKLERLRNFLVLPLYLEQLLWFGTAACLDAWLYTFTILPLRFLKVLSMLVTWWSGNAWKEGQDLVEFVYNGLGRLWRRSRDGQRSGPPSRESSRPRKSSSSDGSAKRQQDTNGVIHAWPTTPQPVRHKNSKGHRHRRTRSTPSLLQATHKADLLKGLLVIISSIMLMKLDPSRIYHNVRGQAAVKLYVIYNALEVCSMKKKRLLTDADSATGR